MIRGSQCKGEMTRGTKVDCTNKDGGADNFENDAMNRTWYIAAWCEYSCTVKLGAQSIKWCMVRSKNGNVQYKWHH